MRTIPKRVTGMLQNAAARFRTRFAGEPMWRQNAEVAALCDGDRHLGHAIRADNYWVAYDSIHFNPANNGYRIIGTFASLSAAKRAIEGSVCLDFAGIVEVAVDGKSARSAFASGGEG